MKIYTKTGDDGTTGLFGGGRVPKDNPRIEAYGTVDELNTHLGAARALGVGREVEAVLVRLQSELFILGADLATPGAAQPGRVVRLSADHVVGLESLIDTYDGRLEPLTSFILPGGAPAAAQLHVARTVCRRAERAVLRLSRSEQLDGPALVYLNRLSDLLFVLARTVNRDAGVRETRWPS